MLYNSALMVLTENYGWIEARMLQSWRVEQPKARLASGRKAE
jgi:hypothetical protein